MRVVACLAASVVLLAGCEGAILPPPTQPEPERPVEEGPRAVEPFACDPQQQPQELPLRRLSQQQYVNSIRAVIAEAALPQADRDAVRALLEPDLLRYPDDRRVGVPGERHGGFERLDQALQQEHVDVSYEVALALGDALVATDARRGALLGTCAVDADTGNDAKCLSDFVASFGALVARRPLTDAEITALVAVAESTPVAQTSVADVIATMLTGPRFLYHVEEVASAQESALDAWAVASRLSYHFWQAPPDRTLRELAASGALLDETTYRQQVERLFNDPRTDAALEQFFSEWFRLEELTPLNALVGTPVYDAFAGDDSPSMHLNEEMKEEVLDVAMHIARGDGSLSDLLTSRKFFARSDALAKLYGQPRWDGVSAPVDFAQPERAGLLTRAAFLASGSANTRPIIKGFRIRNALLCETIPPPPDNVDTSPIQLSADMTTRETVEALTEQPGSACMGCHKTLLNPLGFATENFDALGRVRTHQRLFDAQGNVIGEKPVNTQVLPNLSGVTETVAGIADVTRIIDEGGLFHTCFARQYFRYTFGRMEDDTRDGCALADLQKRALEHQTLGELLRSTALRPEFRERRLP